MVAEAAQQRGSRAPLAREASGQAKAPAAGAFFRRHVHLSVSLGLSRMKLFGHAKKVCFRRCGWLLARSM